MNDKTMGQRIAQCRRDQKLSQEALGDQMGVSRQAISKWEADAAVPEIDKLIALSRLFGVSVGWLLGVEENSPRQEEELTDTQLKMVEEIVKRYQPAREAGKKKSHWEFGIPLLAVALAAAALIFSFARKDDDPAANSEQLSSLQASYSGIQGQLSDISARLDALEDASLERLLLNYQFHFDGVDQAGNTIFVTGSAENEAAGMVVSSMDVPTAVISFTAVPRQHSDADTAFLTVTVGGAEIQKADCQWNGTTYTGKLNLLISDGYEVVFTVCHADGTQECQILENPNVMELAQSLTIQLDVEEAGNVRYTRCEDHDELEFTDFAVDCCAPALNADADWESFGFALYLNGEEWKRDERNDHDPEIIGADGFSFYSADSVFEIPTLQEGDRLELRVYAALENGVSAEKTAAIWVYTNGALEQQTLDGTAAQINRFGF